MTPLQKPSRFANSSCFALSAQMASRGRRCGELRQDLHGLLLLGLEFCSVLNVSVWYLLPLSSQTETSPFSVVGPQVNHGSAG